MRPSPIVPVTTTSGGPSDAERSQIFDLMGELQLHGMKAAFDEIMATAIKRQHEPQRIVGDLLTAEISGEAGALDQVSAHRRQATPRQGPRRLPVRGHPDPTDARQRPRCRRLRAQRAMPCWSAAPGTTARPILPSPLPRSCIRQAAPAAGSQCGRSRQSIGDRDPQRPARPTRFFDHLTRMDYIILDELGVFACRSLDPAVSSCSISSADSTSEPRSSSPRTSPSANGPAYSATPR